MMKMMLIENGLFRFSVLNVRVENDFANGNKKMATEDVW